MIGVLIFPDFQLLDAAGPISVFDIAHRYARSEIPIRVIAAKPGPVRSTSGAEMMARKFGPVNIASFVPDAVEALTRGLINKVLHQPLQAMKAAARNGDLTVAEAVRQIFGLTAQSGGTVPQNDAEPRKEAAGGPVSEAAERDAVEATRR